MKFSIIVPVFNVEKYLEKCLDSLVNQRYDDYEIILINDGSTDNSQKIIDIYQKKYSNKIRSFKKKNGGLSDARNFGLNHVTGDYIIFCDSDDYLDDMTLLNINNEIKNDRYDVVRFLFNIVDENGNTIKQEISNFSGKIKLKEMLALEYSNSACCYAFNSAFWKKYNFKFEKGRVHEDFGLIPLVLLLSNSMYAIDENLYNYVMRGQSITNGAEKNWRRAEDMLYHYDNLMEIVNKYEINNDSLSIYKSYISNGLISFSKNLSGKDLKKYIVELKKRNICNNLIEDSFKRKIKKILLKLNMNLFIKFFNK